MRAVKEKSLLIVAVETNSAKLRAEHQLGIGPALDYVELARELDAFYMDNNSQSPKGLLSNRRLDLSLAARVVGEVRRNNYKQILCMSEGIGIPLATAKKFGLLPQETELYTIMHHPLSSHQRNLTKLIPYENLFDKVFCLSQIEAKIYQQISGLPHNKVGVLPSPPIDTGFYFPSFETSRNYTLSMGVSDRDYTTLIKAVGGLPGLRSRISATSLWVDAVNIASEIPTNVEQIDCRTPQQTVEEVNGAKFMVVPILENSSQLSAGCTSLVLAGAMGIPTIYSRHPEKASGLDDYAAAGITALTVKPGDPYELREAMRELWNDPIKANRMGKNALEFVRENFSLEAWINRAAKSLSSDISQINAA